VDGFKIETLKGFKSKCKRKMFKKSHTIDLTQLQWSEDLLQKIDKLINEEDIDIIIHEIQAINKHLFDNTKEISGCGNCNTSMPYKLLTPVEGTYKFSHSKLWSTSYDLCPICIYIASKNSLYANECSETCTYDSNGLIMNRPTDNCDDSDWCFVHPSIYTSDEARDNCNCDYGCQYCKINPRFCYQNK